MVFLDNNVDKTRPLGGWQLATGITQPQRPAQDARGGTEGRGMKLRWGLHWEMWTPLQITLPSSGFHPPLPRTADKERLGVRSPEAVKEGERWGRGVSESEKDGGSVWASSERAGKTNGGFQLKQRMELIPSSRDAPTAAPSSTPSSTTPSSPPPPFPALRGATFGLLSRHPLPTEPPRWMK